MENKSESLFTDKENIQKCNGMSVKLSILNLCAYTERIVVYFLSSSTFVLLLNRDNICFLVLMF